MDHAPVLASYAGADPASSGSSILFAAELKLKFFIGNNP